MNKDKTYKGEYITHDCPTCHTRLAVSEDSKLINRFLAPDYFKSKALQHWRSCETCVSEGFGDTEAQYKARLAERQKNSEAAEVRNRKLGLTKFQKTSSSAG